MKKSLLLLLAMAGPDAIASDQPPAPSPRFSAFVMPSGRSIAVVGFDAGGAPIPLESVAPPDEVQSVSLADPPAGGRVVLSHGGRSSPPIPVIDNPQVSYGLWTFATTPGRRYSVSATWISKQQQGASVQLFEILGDSGKVLASSRQTMRMPPGESTDGPPLPNGSNSRWNVIGTLAATAATHRVRVSATGDGQWYLDGLRVQDVESGTFTYLDDQDGSLSAVPRVGQLYKTERDAFNGTATAIPAGGIGHRYVVDPALYPKATGRGYSISASDASGTGPWTVTFGGPQGGKNHPLITSDDPAVKVSRVTAGGNFPTYSVDGAPPVPLTAQPIWVKKSPYAMYPTAAPIRPGGSATITLPDGWASTASGPLPAASVKGTSLVGGSLLPRPSAAPTMEVGYNHEGEQYAGTVPLHSNLARRASLRGTGGNQGSAITLDPDGYPIKIDSPAVQHVAIAGQPGAYGIAKGLYGLPNGLYTVLWDWDGKRAASDVTIDPYGAYTASEVGAYRRLTGKANNVRVYNLQGDPAKRWGPDVQITYTASARDPSGRNWLASLRNLRVYPPDPADPSGRTPWVKFPAAGAPIEPPKFHPAGERVVGHVQWLRFLDPLNSNNNQVHDFSDFRPASNLSYYGYGTRTAANIASVTPVPAGVDPYFSTKRSVVILVTTETPHGLFDGEGSVVFIGSGTIRLSGGGSRRLDGLRPTGIRVTSPTTFLAQIMNSPLNDPPYNQSVDNSLGRGGQVVATRGTALPIGEIVEICNRANGGAGCGLWWNAPFVATPECHAEAAAYLAANLKGKLIVEAGNEAWHFNFQLYSWCCTLNYKRTGKPADDNSFMGGYVERMKAIHQAYVAAFVAAGRPASDVIRAMGTQGGNPGLVTRALCAQVVEQYGAEGAKTAVDLLATATYFDAQAPGAGPQACDPLTSGQILDFTELQMKFGEGIPLCVSSHRQYLDAAGMKATRIGQYEGGIEHLLPGKSPADGYIRSWAALNHTRMKGIQAGFLALIQDAGSSINMTYFAGGYQATGNGQHNGWCTYTGYGQLPGTGDPVADALNDSNPGRMDRIKSQRGGAIEDWAASVSKK